MADCLVKKYSSLVSSDLTPELRLMLACLRTFPLEKEVRQIEKLSQHKIEWRDFLMWVDRHRVAPLVFTNLIQFAEKAVPPSVMNDLRTRFQRNAHRGLVNATQLVRLYKRFQENGIPTFPLKGSVLAFQVYGDLALRHAGDIDLLVAPRHVESADRLLQADHRRIAPSFHLTPSQQNRFYSLYHHFEYLHDQNNLSIELHWRLIPFLSSQFMNFGWLQGRAEYVAFGGSQLPAMSQEDTILYLCAHGAVHYWFRLFWLVDLAEIIRQDQRTDWDRLMIMAGKLGIVRPLAQGVLLAHIFCGIPLPEPIRVCATGDRVMPYMTKVACRNILCVLPYKQPIPLSMQNKVYLLRLCSHPKNKVTILRRILAGDYWKTVRLPDALFPLYYIMRPFIWLHGRLRGGQGEVERHLNAQE